MLTINSQSALAKAITPTYGIPDAEISNMKTPMKRYVNEWLQEREQGEHAWSMNPYDKEMIDEVIEIGNRVLAEGIRTVVWIGIGGSGLGPKVLTEVLGTKESPECIIVDSIDPKTLHRLIEGTDWKNALIVVVSKSGGTLETMSAFFLCFNALKTAVRSQPGNRVIAITDKEGGPLRSFARANKLHTLTIPHNVGGRYSIFTPVGLLMVHLLGGDVKQFTKGAKEMDTFCQETDLLKNPAASLASIQYLLDTKRGYPIRVMMPYGDSLVSLARWEQQLIAESLGKNEIFNPIPVAAIGTQDQHSLLQQWMAGPRKSWHLFIREVNKMRLEVPKDIAEQFQYIGGKSFGQLLDACYEGTSQALTNAKRPNVTISIDNLDEYHMGQLFFLFMAEVVLLGKLYRIDIYGQPAVEIGKQITRGILTKGQNIL